jgi:uncharacterized SAM-binding protein YcdF (DUF218 family)
MNHLYDVGVVLGAAVRSNGAASRALLRRVAHGVALYRSGTVARLLMSGGIVRYPRAEAAYMREAALAAGVPDGALLVEDRSVDTLENARFCRDIIAAAGWRRVLLVTDAFHLPRALYAFRRLCMPVDGEAVPRPSVDAGLIGSYLREMVAMPIYFWRVERASGVTRPASPTNAG